VDYADGLVVCVAVDLFVAVAARPMRGGEWGVASGDRRARRRQPLPAGDIGDRPLAVAVALGDAGVDVPAVEIGIAASLPEGAGLSSSAALCCATAVALLRITSRRLGARELAAVALAAERDIVGVPCGPLDQRAIVGAPDRGALLLDCRSGDDTALPGLPSGTCLIACHTGQTHDVGGADYRCRRQEVDGALSLGGAPTWRDIEPARLDRLDLPPPLDRRARHVVSETARAGKAAQALRHGDAMALGHLMRASHASLRDDFEVSTAALDAVVAAAESVPGCLGARLVGAGFGGSAVALVRGESAGACLAAMDQAAGAAGGGARRLGAWRLGLAPGLAVTSADVIG
jgi:galactokinase